MCRSARELCKVASAARLGLLCLGLLGSLALSGCPSGGDKGGSTAEGSASAPAPTPAPDDAPVSVGAVKLRGEAPGVEAATVEARVREALLKQPGFAAEGASGAHPPVEVSGTWSGGWTDPRDGSGQVLGSARVNLKLTSPLPAPAGMQRRYVAEAIVGEALPTGAPPEAAARELLLRVIEETTLNLVKQVRVDRASDADLLTLLDADDPELLEFAIDGARARRLKAASPALVRLLRYRERPVVNRAAAALGVVGEPSAVGPLIDAGSRVELLDRLPVLFALGELGGPEATLYLETLAGTEGLEPQLATAVQSALKRAREPRGGATP